MARVLRQITAIAGREAMFEPGSRVVVTCSGGPDSLCLLHSLARLRRLLRIDLVCFHFDHGLREGSESDSSYVSRQARALGVPFRSSRAGSRPRRGASVEAWARAERYRALGALRDELGGATAALGHTRDDQAETVLLALFRGGGLRALSGMSPVSEGIVRPLLATARADTEAFCRAIRVRPRRDPMNEDPSFMRVAVRTRILPELERRLGRGIGATIARTGALLREDADMLDLLAEEAAVLAFVPAKAPRASPAFRAGMLSGLDRPIGSRVVHRALRELGVDPASRHVEAILDLAAGPGGRAVSLPGGLRARRIGEYVRLFRPSPDEPVVALSRAGAQERTREAAPDGHPAR